VGIVHNLRTTSVAGLTLWHIVSNLGPGVGENVATLVKQYAGRAGLNDLSLIDHSINLSGPGWDAPWQTLVTVDGCKGQSGPSNEELSGGGEMYWCLLIELPVETLDPIQQNDPHPHTIEGTIAHEITHLRWPSLQHGPEFNARVIALLKGADFPVRGGWKRFTKQIMEQARREVRNWYAKFIPGLAKLQPK